MTEASRTPEWTGGSFLAIVTFSPASCAGEMVARISPCDRAPYRAQAVAPGGDGRRRPLGGSGYIAEKAPPPRAADPRPRICSPESGYAALSQGMADLEQEEMHVLVLDSKGRALGPPIVLYRGTLSNIMVRVCEVFRAAIRLNATSILVAHNHPSGDPTPSAEDIRLTRSLVDAGRELDIEVLDHLVIGRDCYVSLKARGLGFA
jgi:hypothetical protein